MLSNVLATEAEMKNGFAYKNQNETSPLIYGTN